MTNKEILWKTLCPQKMLLKSFYDLADNNKLTDVSIHDEDLKEDQAKQQLALDTVHDFLINNI